MITKTSKKRVVTTIQTTTSVIGGITNISIPLTINQAYSRVNEIANYWGGYIPPRKGFGYLDDGKKKNLALWCINLSKNPYWENVLCDKGKTIKERKITGESPKEFQTRIIKDDSYNVNVKRLCFAKGKGGIYYFLGLFRLSQLDFDTQTAIFKKEEDTQFILKIRKTKKVVFTFEEETEIVFDAQTL